MQLILDTEPAIDIKRTMSTLDQESLSEQLDNVIQDLKDNICSGNKENIQTQNNVIIEDNKDLVTDTDKINGNEIIPAQLPLQYEDLDEQETKDLECISYPKQTSQTDLDKSSVIVDPELDKNNELDTIVDAELSKDVASEPIVDELEKEEESDPIVDVELDKEVPSEPIDGGELEKEKESDPIVNVELGKEVPSDPIIGAKLDKEIVSDPIVDTNLDKGVASDPIVNTELDKEVAPDPIVDGDSDKESTSLSDHMANAELDKEAASNLIDVELDKEEESDPIVITPEKAISEIVNNIVSVEKESENLNSDKQTLKDFTEIVQDIEMIENDIILAGTDEDVFKEQINEDEAVSIHKEDKPKTTEDNIMEIDSDGEDDIVRVIENNEHKEIASKDNASNNNMKIGVEEVDAVNEINSREDSEILSPIKHIDDMEIEEVRETPEVKHNLSTNKIASGESITAKDCVSISDTFITEKNKQNNTNTLDVDKTKEINDVKDEETTCQELKSSKDSNEETKTVNTSQSVLKLSNTLDILSDDEDEPSKSANETNKVKNDLDDKQCINIEEDDDIMLIDEDTNSKENKNEVDKNKTEDHSVISEPESKDILNKPNTKEISETESVTSENLAENKMEINLKDQETEKKSDVSKTAVTKKPLLPDNFLKTHKKSLADMTRDDLEEFCILKIVESIVDRSNLGEITAKLKTMSQNIEEYKKKAMMLTKQNRDLQVVLKSVQEEQKKRSDTLITPLKITRSVGMQVLMTEKPGMRRKPPVGIISTPNNNNTNNNNNNNPVHITRSNRTLNQSPRNIKQPAPNPGTIPVPRLVPALNSNVTKTSSPLSQIAGKSITPMNGVKTPSPVQKPEKRPHNKVQMSVTVDLTDDEPPSKITTRSSPAPPVRLVPSQNLLAPQRQQLGQSSPRKVYIPISGPQGNIRPGQAIMLKSTPTMNPRPRGPQIPKQVRMSRILNRHPAPLPDTVKQYQPPHWKMLPPAPDLKLSKVENGIVISWKIEGYQEDSYEEIASYQLYAYQETSSPPSTTLWKKIGDVKALPLPMACTLTQFMAGFKYYFAVRAVDIRSRLGPFSLPGSILLLNKM